MSKKQKITMKVFMIALGALLVLIPFVGCASTEQAEPESATTAPKPWWTPPESTQPVKEEPAKEEPAKEEPAKEEPAKEEPAKEEPAPPAKETVIFADLGWDSIQVHNQIAAFILENGYGYPESEFVPSETIPGFVGLTRGDIHVNMEIWTENQQEAVDKAVAANEVVDLGDNFWDNWQGWLVPTYVIEGDAERGIEALAPDLKSVDDLPNYWEIFEDPEDSTKGRFVSCIAGWECEKINEEKIIAYGLDEYYNIILPGSGAALLADMKASYEKGEPWFGYYWAPTPALGQLDMTAIEEPAYDEAIWNDTHACAYPAVHVNIMVNAAWHDANPEAVEFLTKYSTTTAQNNDALGYMDSNEASPADAAVYFLQEYESQWTAWVPADVASKVKAALP